MLNRKENNCKQYIYKQKNMWAKEILFFVIGMLLFIGYKHITRKNLQELDLDVYTYTVAAVGLSAIYYFLRNKSKLFYL